MLELGLIVLVLLGAWLIIRSYSREANQEINTSQQTQYITRLWEYVHTAMKRQRWEKAERALLKILKYDHKNTSAYNQLGMIYVRSQQPENAIACFDIASSLAPSISSLYNLGLVHYQMGNLQEAARALEKVVDLEPTPKRLLVFAKILQKNGQHKKVVDVVERAVDMDPSERNLQYLAEAYEAAGQPDKAQEAQTRITHLRNQTPPQFQPEQMRATKQ